ncbi:unnamed protein product, partial [marine sediment metagenome]
ADWYELNFTTEFPLSSQEDINDLILKYTYLTNSTVDLQIYNF